MLWQEKLLYQDNTLETFILRLSYLIDSTHKEHLYELCPMERFAEIKSFNELLIITSSINNNLFELLNVLAMEKQQRLLRGYHYVNASVNSPLITFFTMGNKQHLLNSFEWYDMVDNNSLIKVDNIYSLNERLYYGFPISTDEYSNSMVRLVRALNGNFVNRINIKR